MDGLLISPVQAQILRRADQASGVSVRVVEHCPFWGRRKTLPTVI